MATTMTTAASVLEEESALTSGTGLRRAGAICALLQVAMLAVMFAIFLGAAPALSFDALGRDPAASVTALRRGAGVYVPLADFMVIAAATLGIVVLALRAQFLQRRSDLISVGSLFGFFAALTLLVGNGLIVTLVSWAQRLPSDVGRTGCSSRPGGNEHHAGYRTVHARTMDRCAEPGRVAQWWLASLARLPWAVDSPRRRGDPCRSATWAFPSPRVVSGGCGRSVRHRADACSGRRDCFMTDLNKSKIGYALTYAAHLT